MRESRREKDKSSILPDLKKKNEELEQKKKKKKEDVEKDLQTQAVLSFK